MLTLKEHINLQESSIPDKLEMRVLNGVDGVNSAIKLLKGTKSDTSEIMEVYKNVNPAILNYIKSNRMIKRDMNEWIAHHGHGKTISDVREFVVGLMNYAINKVNKDIVDARKPLPSLDARFEARPRRRPRYVKGAFLRKRRTINFYKNHPKQLYYLFRLYNAILSCKSGGIDESRNIDKLLETQDFITSSDKGIVGTIKSATVRRYHGHKKET